MKNILHLPVFWAENMQKTVKNAEKSHNAKFGPENAVRSTQFLVEIFNNRQPTGVPECTLGHPFITLHKQANFGLVLRHYELIQNEGFQNEDFQNDSFPNST